MVKYFVYAIFFMFPFASCQKKKDDSFSFARTDYTGNNLRLDGYYYYYDVKPARYRIYFFYRNGILLYGEPPLKSELESQERSYRDGSYYDMVKGDLSYWRIFRVLGNIIEFESRTSDGTTGLRVFNDSGYIENDTTFTITKTMRVNGENLEEVSETYHFKAFFPKPDSTNSFIE